MDKIEQKKEYVIKEALRLFENGKSRDFVLDLYPQYNKDLLEIFEVINSIDLQKDIEVPESIFKSLLSKIPDSKVSFLIPSPFSKMNRFYNVKKFSLFSTLALFLFVGGGFLYYQHGIDPNVTNSQTTEASLNNDIDTIDLELTNLDNDAYIIDNNLDNQSPGVI